MGNFTWASFALRFLFSLLLVFLTFNPSGYSYFHWADFAPLPVLCGVLLFVGWVIYCRATIRSIGFFGLGLIAAVMACIIWLLIDMELLSLSDVTVLTWAIEFCIALALAVGMSWSHVRRRLSGQVDIDDVET